MNFEITMIAITSILFGALYLYLIFAMFGKCGNMLRGYCTTCTNRTEENKNQQLYVKRCYALKNLIISAFVHSSILCLIFKQYIACIVLFAMTFVSWGIIELVLAKCTKYQSAKAEISDDKRMQDYYDGLQNNDKNDES